MSALVTLIWPPSLGGMIAGRLVRHLEFDRPVRRDADEVFTDAELERIERTRARERQHYLKNKARIDAYQAAYRSRHRAAIAEYQRRYREAHPARTTEWCRANRDRVNAQQRARRAANRDRLNARRRASRLARKGNA